MVCSENTKDGYETSTDANNGCEPTCLVTIASELSRTPSSARFAPFVYGSGGNSSAEQTVSSNPCYFENPLKKKAPFLLFKES